MFGFVMLIIAIIFLLMLPKALHNAWLILFANSRDPRRIKLINKLRKKTAKL